METNDYTIPEGLFDLIFSCKKCGESFDKVDRIFKGYHYPNCLPDELIVECVSQEL